MRIKSGNVVSKVSVIIPVYNVEKYLRECLDSVCTQTLREIDIICVDDGSTDSSPVILSKYLEKDSRLRVYTQENKGSGPARNMALDNATGECVCFMDPDDKYPEDDVLEKMYYALNSFGCEVVGGNLRFMSEDGRCVEDKDYGYSGRMSYATTQQQYGYQCYLFKRDMIERNNIRFPILWRRQDPPFFVKCMLAAKDFYAIKDIVYVYRTRNASRPVDWLANGAVRLKDNLTGIEMVGELAKENGLWMLYAHNFRCLSEGAFSKVREASIVWKRLKAFVREVEKSGKIPRCEIVNQAERIFLSEHSRIRRYLAILGIFGFGIVELMLLRRIRQKFRRVLQ